MALCKRFVQSGAHLVKLRLLDATTHKTSSFSAAAAAAGKIQYRRHFSELARPSCGANRAFLVDTLALVRRLESQEVPSKQAEAITTALIAVLNDSLESLSHSYASKEEMHKIEMSLESSLSKFKAEVQSAQVAREMIQESSLSKFQNELQSNFSKFQSEVQSSEDHHFSMLQRESEKQKADIEKVNEKLQSDIDKVNEKLQGDIDKKYSELRFVLDLEEINAVRALIEAAKYDIIKYCIGTLVSISAVGLAVLRIML
ncbi:hypothetical protein LINGRAHAP2_LOCUS16418 [Linum grandiflorum]